MGLTGGGYSDYLNAQAYAQKRSDIQSAGAKRADLESQAQATYSAGIAALNKEQADMEQKKQDQYTAVLADLQNATNYANYTEDGIIAIGNQKGWTASQVAEAVKTWKAAKSANEIDAGGGEGSDAITSANIIKEIENGVYEGYTWEQIKEMMLKARNAGENITEDDIAKVKQAYDNWKAYKEDGKISMDVYYNANAGDEAAQNTIDNVLDPKTFNDNAIEEAKKLLAQQSAGTSEQINYWLKDAKVVNVNTGTVTSYKDFNNDIGKNDNQEDYWNALKADLSKVAVGQYIMPNYGAKGTSGKNEYFLCVAPGVFVAMPSDGAAVPSSDKIYVPNGYKVNWQGKIKKD